MNSEKEQAEVLRRIRAWLAESGVTTSTVDAPEKGVAQHLTFSLPPSSSASTTVHLIRVEDRPLTVLVTGTTVSAPHLQALHEAAPGLRQHVMKELRRVAFTGGVVGFVPQADGEVVGSWQLNVELYDDGLTQQAFFAGIRALISKHLELLDTFSDALGSKVGPDGSSTPEPASYIR